MYQNMKFNCLFEKKGEEVAGFQCKKVASV